VQKGAATKCPISMTRNPHRGACNAFGAAEGECCSIMLSMLCARRSLHVHCQMRNALLRCSLRNTVKKRWCSPGRLVPRSETLASLAVSC